MPHHFQKWVTEAKEWCNKCGRFTRHAVSCGRLAHCLEHDPPALTKKQIKRREEQARAEQNPTLFPTEEGQK
jgi:hypothetical protein